MKPLCQKVTLTNKNLENKSTRKQHWDDVAINKVEKSTFKSKNDQRCLQEGGWTWLCWGQLSSLISMWALLDDSFRV